MRLVETDRWRISLRTWRLPLRLSSWTASPYAPLLVILAVGFGFYAPTIGDWFFADDFWFLRASQSTPPGSYVLDTFDYRHPGPIIPEFLYRPGYMVVFRGMYEGFGLHAWPYHFVSLAFHLACGALLWFIALKITRRPLVGHLAALIFLLHPAYVVAVAWVVNGNAVMGTFAYLSSLLCFLHHLDGGARRRFYYGASLLAFVAALLLHPETSFAIALFPLSYVLLRAGSLRELLSVRAWTQFLPFLVIEIGFAVTIKLVRQANIDQAMIFKIGPHMAGNYAKYAALALNPYRASTDLFAPDSIPLNDMRTLMTLAGGVAAGVALLFFERKRLGAGSFALGWFLLAILPETTWIAGAFARKLYGVGPGLALAVAVLAVSCWDRVAPRLRGGLRSVAPAVLLFLVTMLLGARVLMMTDAFRKDAEGYHYMVEQVRTSTPVLPEGSRLYLVGVPWVMLVGGNEALGLASALRLYYGDIEIFVVVSDEQLARLPDPPRANDVVFRYRCPPICQPPLN